MMGRRRWIAMLMYHAMLLDARAMMQKISVEEAVAVVDPYDSYFPIQYPNELVDLGWITIWQAVRPCDF
jgi:hypothetical protein